MKTRLILKCEGRIDNGFRFCSGVENVILDLETVEATEGYIGLIQYLDKVVGIFDRPCVKPHIVSNAMFKIHEMGYIDEKTYNNFSKFWNIHKICGIILLVLPK